MSRRVHVSPVVCLPLLVVPSWSQLGASSDSPAHLSRSPLWLAVGPCSVGRDDEVRGVVAMGPIEVLGTVQGDIISFGGQVTLGESADVWGNITAVCSEVKRAEGAQVHGKVCANALPDMALIDIEHRGLYEQVFRIGPVELRPGERNPLAMLALGGDIFVGEGVGTNEIIAIGGDVIVEPGAEVTKIIAIGGETTRPEGDSADADEAIPPAVIPWGRLGGNVGRPGAPAEGGTSADVHHHASSPSSSLQLATRADGGASLAIKRESRPSLMFDLAGRVAADGYGKRQELTGPTSDDEQSAPDAPDDYFRAADLVAAGLSLRISSALDLTAQPGTSTTETIYLAAPSGLQALHGYGR